MGDRCAAGDYGRSAGVGKMVSRKRGKLGGFRDEQRRRARCTDAIEQGGERIDEGFPIWSVRPLALKGKEKKDALTFDKALHSSALKGNEHQGGYY